MNPLLVNIHNHIVNTVEDGWTMHDEPTTNERIYDCDSFDIACDILSNILEMLYNYRKHEQGAICLNVEDEDEEVYQVIIKDFD